jgi:hypothetical protein
MEEWSLPPSKIFSPFSLLQLHLTLWFSWEEGASAPSSFSSPFRLLPLPHPYLPASFAASPLVSSETLSASLEVLSAFSKALCYSFPVLSAFSEVFPAISLFSNTIHRPRHRARTIPENFRFEFLNFRFVFFRKPKPETRQCTVLMGSSASRRLQQLARPALASRRVAFTRSRGIPSFGRVNFTFRCVVRRSLCVLSSSTSL